MKVTFNSLGQIAGGINFEGQVVRQGSTDIVLKAVFLSKLNINYNAKFNLARSDGTNITNVVMNLGADSNTYIYALNDEWYFAKAGQTTLTIFLVDGNGTQIATGQVQFNVQANDYDEEPETIGEEQYNSLLALINAKASVNQVVMGFSVMPTPTQMQDLSDGQIFAVVNGTRKLYKVVDVTGTKVANEVFDFSKFPNFTKQEIEDLLDELEENLQQQIDDNKDDADAHFSDINDKIPATASSTNKLVDRDTMNSSITQSASFFRGNFETHAALASVSWQATNPSGDYYVTNNDYAIVEEDETHINPDTGLGETWRYKCVVSNGSIAWVDEYKVNDSRFTADQKAVLDSGITQAKRIGYDGLDSKKQNKIYHNQRPANPQEGDMVVYETTQNLGAFAAGKGITFQTINGVVYIKSKTYRHLISLLNNDSYEQMYIVLISNNPNEITKEELEILSANKLTGCPCYYTPGSNQWYSAIVRDYYEGVWNLMGSSIREAINLSFSDTDVQVEDTVVEGEF